MSKLMIAAATLGMLIVNLAFAVKEAGNGGNVVVCPSSPIKPVELLDHYEARTLRHLSLDLGPASLSYQEKINLIIKRIARLNPNRAELYKEWNETFISETSFITDMHIIPISDVGVGVIPNGCQLTQIAVQQDPDLPGDVRYTIRKDLWDQLDNDGKAGLVLHELMYREALHQRIPAQNSKAIRYLNGFVSSTAMEAATLKQYIAAIELTEFTWTDAQGGIPIALVDFDMNGKPHRNSLQYINDNMVWSGWAPKLPEDATPVHLVDWIWRGLSFPNVEKRPRNWLGSYYSKPVLGFNSDGSIRYATIAKDFTLDLGWVKIDAHRGSCPASTEVTDHSEEVEIRVPEHCDDSNIVLTSLNGSARFCRSYVALSTINKAIEYCQ